MNVADLLPLANHLWQSTLFVAVVGLLALSLRRNQARVRHCLWLAASVKFLVPFAVLVAIGRQCAWRSADTVQPGVAFVIDSIGRPFARPALAAMTSPATASPLVRTLPVLLLAISFAGCAMHLFAWWVRSRRIADVVRKASPVNSGRDLDVLRRLEHTLGLRRPISLVSSDTSLEPGIFGIITPVLVWPRSISARLADGQLEAVLAHELCHVRRRDNLAAAVHMIVEAAFWFHPVVWWIEKRLVDERERACDEEVIRLGNEPQVYAESILRICEFCAESQLACVAGVTGSDLKKRIEAIMRGHVGERLSGWNKFLLAAAVVATVGAPVAAGVSNAPPRRAQSAATDAKPQAFDVASIKPNKSAGSFSTVGFPPGGRFTASNVTLRQLIMSAYGVPNPLDVSRVIGGPEWIDSDRFDIQAKAAGESSPPELLLMLRSLLAERFRLGVRSESRELPIYALVMARRDGRLGPQLQPSEDCGPLGAGRRTTPAAPNAPLCGGRGSPGRLTFGGIPISTLVAQPALTRDVKRIIVDRTGLSGAFSGILEWTPNEVSLLPPGPPPPDAPPPPRTDGPSIFTAFEEQLGLKLESTGGPVEVIVIEHAEHPTPD